MDKLKGKCKKCLGCNRLNDMNFKGTDECKNYIKADVDVFSLIVALVELIGIVGVILAITMLFIRLKMAVGG